MPPIPPPMKPAPTPTNSSSNSGSVSEPAPVSGNIRPQPRRATENDIPALTHLWQETGLYRPYNPPQWDVQFALSSADATLFVWEDNSDNIIGSVMVGHDGHRGWVYYLAVSPAMQKSGLGVALMAVAENWLRGRNVWRMQLMVRNDNHAVQGFYHHLGYRACDVAVLQKDIGIPDPDRLKPAD